MARAEYVGVRNFVHVETCGHILCECKLQLDDTPEESLAIPEVISEGNKFFTEIQIESGDKEKMIRVPGIHRYDEIIEAFNNCEAPEITAKGVICGAMYRLGRK